MTPESTSVRTAVTYVGLQIALNQRLTSANPAMQNAGRRNVLTDIK